jgi:hypothetical protein
MKRIVLGIFLLVTAATAAAQTEKLGAVTRSASRCSSSPI